MDIICDEEKKQLLEDLFFERLDFNYELWSIVYETAKMGDNFYEVIPDDYKKPKKIIALVYREPEKIEKIEKDGKVLYYKYTKESDDYLGRIKKEEKSELKLQPWQIIHFKFEDKDTKPYGGSLLKSGVRSFRRLNLLEDVLLIYRISRAPERRVFYIDVGGLSPSEAKQYVNRIKNIYRSENFIDENGNINRKANIMSINTDIIVPRREGQGTQIEPLPGGEALNSIDDLKYWRDKILRTMNIPASYMGDEANRAQNLSALDQKFGRFIERIQNQVKHAFIRLQCLNCSLLVIKKKN
jgi:Bacteriophage T4-like capsid assembly protein (Gp20).